MKMLQIAALAALLISCDADAGPRARRDTCPEARIAAGRAQGELTRCEALRLFARNRAIAARARLYAATGAGIGPLERRDLLRRRAQLARDIIKQRRDGRGCW